MDNLEKLDDMVSIGPADIIKIAEDQGRLFKNMRIKTNQIRNFYSEINSMKLIYKDRGLEDEQRLNELELKLIMLKPKLAYAAGRQRGVRKVYDFMSAAIDGVKNAPQDDKLKAFQNFFNLVESVVAYHKFFGDN